MWGKKTFAKAVPSDKCSSQGKTKMPLEIDETGLVMIKWNDVWACPLNCSHIERNVEFRWKNITLFLSKFCTIWDKERYEFLTRLSHNSVWFCFSKQLKRDLDDTFKKGSWNREQFLRKNIAFLRFIYYDCLPKQSQANLPLSSKIIKMIISNLFFHFFVFLDLACYLGFYIF